MLLGDVPEPLGTLPGWQKWVTVGQAFGGCSPAWQLMLFADCRLLLDAQLPYHTANTGQSPFRKARLPGYSACICSWKIICHNDEESNSKGDGSYFLTLSVQSPHVGIYDPKRLVITSASRGAQKVIDAWGEGNSENSGAVPQKFNIKLSYNISYIPVIVKMYEQKAYIWLFRSVWFVSKQWGKLTCWPIDG